MSLENIAEICIAIDTAILGIAYPIIIDKISNIGDNILRIIYQMFLIQSFHKMKLNWEVKRFQLFNLCYILPS